MTPHTRTWLYAAAMALALAGCSDDDGAQGDAGSVASPGKDAGGAPGAGSGGANAGGAGASGAGSGGGASGAGAGAGAGGGDEAGASGADAGAAQKDAGGAGSGGSGGTSGGSSFATTCGAPMPAQSPGNACPGDDPVRLQLIEFASGLDDPVFVTHAPGDASGRLFVVQRGGSVVVLDRDGQNLGEFLDVQVTSGFTEQGLLGLAFDPRYQDNGRFFINYTVDGGLGVETRIESYRVSASDPNVADPTSQELLFSFDQPQQNHNGGMLAFGPDGCLFASTGDGGGGNDPDGNGQSLSTPLGKILRFDPDDPDNAAPGNLSADVPHLWDYGMRNPWRFSFDRLTGDLYMGDVGQDDWEEVDVEPAGTGQRNYGWKVMEGMHCRGSSGPPTGCDTTGLTLPVDEYVTGTLSNCVIGGYVYRGSAIPSLDGWYVYGDNGSSNLWAFVWDGSGRCGDRTLDLTDRDNLDPGGEISSFGEDADGELYVVTRGGAGNIIYRIEAAP